MQKTDFDIWQEAYEKLDLSESISPLVRGRLIVEETLVGFYNKIQKLLNSTGMESCHSWLYNVDPLDLSECECDKINSLYKLAQDRGYIEPDVEETPDAAEPDVDLNPAPVTAASEVQTPIPMAAPMTPLKQTAYTVVYSAMRDGMIKTGEAYSNCINTRSAKADVLNKLERAGYQNISILAIEAGDPDNCCGIEEYNKTIPEVPDYSVDETDLTNESGNNEYKIELECTSDKNSVEDFIEKMEKKYPHVEFSEIEKFDKNNGNYVVYAFGSKSDLKKLFTDPLYGGDSQDFEELIMKHDEDEELSDEERRIRYEETKGDLQRDEDVDEADDREPLSHVLDHVGIKASTANLKKNNVVSMTTINDSDDMYSFGEADDTEDSDDSKNEEKLKDSDESFSLSDDSNDEQETKGDAESDVDTDREEDDSDKDDSKDLDADEEKPKKSEEKLEEPDEKLKDDKKNKSNKDEENHDEDKKLSASEKESLKDSYKKAFKAALEKGKYETSFSELSLDDKIKFFTDLSKAWGKKADPVEFMTDKEIDQLEKIVIKKS